jgi:hypothetical protein
MELHKLGIFTVLAFFFIFMKMSLSGEPVVNYTDDKILDNHHWSNSVDLNQLSKNN